MKDKVICWFFCDGTQKTWLDVCVFITIYVNLQQSK